MYRLCLLLILSCLAMASAWSLSYYPVQRAPIRVYRYATPPLHRIPIPVETEQPQQRPKRGHDHHDHHDYDDHGSSGITGPVHTFVKTDKNANYKWGVRHHVGDKFAS